MSDLITKKELTYVYRRSTKHYLPHTNVYLNGTIIGYIMSPKHSIYSFWNFVGESGYKHETAKTKIDLIGKIKFQIL